MTLTCDNCQKTGPMVKRCGRCKHTNYCGKVCQKQDWADHKWICFPESEGRQPYTYDENGIVFSCPVEDLLDTRRFPTDLVEVRDNPEGGRGVYAKKDIPKGVKICFRGGTLKVGNSKVFNFRNTIIKAHCFDLTDTRCFPTNPTNWTGVKKDLLPAQIDDNSLSVFIQGSDTFTHALGIAQFIRQGDQLKPDETNIKNVCEVLINSILASNCDMSEDNIWYRTTKHVHAGQELLTSFNYRESLLVSKKPEARLMYLELFCTKFDPMVLHLLYRDPFCPEHLLFDVLHFYLCFPRDFLEKREHKKIVDVLRKKIKGYNGFHHILYKEI